MVFWRIKLGAVVAILVILIQSPTPPTPPIPLQPIAKVFNRRIKVPVVEVPVVEVPVVEEANLQKSLRMSRGAKEPTVLTGFEVTYYNNDGINHTTTSGTRTLDGITLGVDPSVIPLGTQVEILMPDGSLIRRRAEDTGGAVKGRILDIYANLPKQELLKRGRIKDVTVRILWGE